MVYLLGWSLIYAAVIIQLGTRYRGSAIILMILPYFAGLAFLRGRVGTDTGSYQLMFQGFSERFYKWDGIEPGFIALAKALLAIMPDIDLAVRATALVFFALLAIYVIRGDQNERFFFIAYFLPTSAYILSMNAIRLGFAITILLFAAQAIRKGTLKRVFLIGLPAIFFHYTALFGLTYLIASQRPWLKFYSFLGILLLILLSIGLFFMADIYFINKITDYAPQDGAGSKFLLTSIFGLFRMSIIFFVLLFTNLPTAEKFRLVFLGEFFIIFGGILAEYTYAGIRIFGLVAFLAPLSILTAYSRLGLNFELKLKLAFIASSLLQATSTFLGFLATAGKQSFPFLPYQTWFP